MKPNSYLQIESLSPLYEDVQQSGIFTDSKYFVDALPKSSVTNILERYAVDNKQTSFSLLKFIRENFIWKTRLNRKHGEKLCLSDSNDWTYTQW